MGAAGMPEQEALRTAGPGAGSALGEVRLRDDRSR